MKKLVCGLLLLTGTTLAFAETNESAICSPTANQTELKQSIKWYRDSAEKTALYRQAYGIATVYVENWVKTHHPKAKSWGVVLDIDETTLDNSWYFIKCSDIADNESDFSHFVSIPAKSVALPGVIEFTRKVHQLGGYVSMVSNRDGSYHDSTGKVLDATVENLKQQQVYFDQVVLANRSASEHPSDKNPRFNAINSGKYVAKDMVWSNELPAHQVIAYFGDNIQDFPKFKQPVMDKLSAEDSTYKIFGNGYFIMPNPMYGSWMANQYK